MNTINKYKIRKQLINSLQLGVILVLLNSCMSDLLNTAPYDKLATNNMWTSDYLTDLGMGGVYQPLRDGFTTGGTADRVLYQFDRLGVTGMKRDLVNFTGATATSTDGLFSNTWKGLYTGINRANDVIHNMPEISPSSEEKKARYVAEAKFLRAYYYFRLNQVYKGVPVYLEIAAADEMTKGRETEEYVWQVIIDDLTDAINEPNLPDKYAAGNADYGHVTKGAAYALRGKTYLYIKEYAKAIADFEQVRNCGYVLFQGGYRELFKEANEQCDEMIFTIQNMDLDGYGSDTQFYCGTRSSKGSCWNTYLVNPTIVEMYENIDGTKFNWEDIIPGYYSISPVQRQVYFLRDNLTEEENSLFIEKGVDLSDYLPDGNEARIKKAYENRDPRLTANVITPYSTYIGVLNDADSEVTLRFPYRTNNEPTQDLRTDTQSYFYYLHRKFVYEGMNEITNRAYGAIDLPIIRYADVLLMWAEALAESNAGISTEAISLINEVRARAGVALLNSSPATTVSSQADLIERIRHERRVEFVNEGINYFDELRWGTWKEMVFFEGAGIKQVWGENQSTYVWQGDYITTWPIPNAEIQLNPNLTQNPGWGS